MRGNLRLILCASALLVAACASAPSLEGGISGTGNSPDCEALKKKGGAEGPVPEECKGQAEAAPYR
jgi:hypothetical protein